MADGTTIEWTDATWNVVNGCSVVSPGCTNCYAMRLAGTRLRNHPSRAGLTIDSKAGPVWTGQTRFNDKVLGDPLKWTRPRRIFVCAHGDLFHDGVPDNVVDQVFAVMALCQQHQFQVLTKRPQRMRDYMAALMAMDADDRDRRFETPAFQVTQAPCVIGCLEDLDWPLRNVWLGVSVEDQARADERVPLLLDTPAAVRWLSCEPLLGPVDLAATNRIDWVVAGGESGPGARPMHPDWARQLRDACATAGVPFLFKQWGSWGDGSVLADGSRLWATFMAPDHPDRDRQVVAWPDGTLGHGSDAEHGGRGVTLKLMPKHQAGRTLDGQLHDGFPRGNA